MSIHGWDVVCSRVKAELVSPQRKLPIVHREENDGEFLVIVAVESESMQLSNHAIELLDATDGVAFHTIVGVASNEF